MRAVLVTAFPEKFVQKCVLPHLRRRVEILAVVPTAKAASIDFENLRKEDLVLHMIEYGGHSDSEQLSRLCRQHGVTIRALSRKKASWNFLPPPSDDVSVVNDLADEIPLPTESDEAMADVVNLELVALGRDLKAAREHAGWKQRELAELVGVTQTTISCHEGGKARASEEYVKKILAACGLAPGWRGLARPPEEPMNAISTESAPVAMSMPEPEMLQLYEAEIDKLKARVRGMENSEAEARSALAIAKQEIADVQAELAYHRKRDAVASAVRTLFEAGLLTADEVVIKLCPKS